MVPGQPLGGADVYQWLQGVLHDGFGQALGRVVRAATAPVGPCGDEDAARGDDDGVFHIITKENQDKPTVIDPKTGELVFPSSSLSCDSCVSVRQAKLVRSSKRKGACHVDCPFDIVAERACFGVIQGTKPREAKMRAARIEPVSASLHQLKVASLPELLKPVTGQEATGMCTDRAFRGERGRRVSKDLMGTWETRQSALASATTKGKQ